MSSQRPEPLGADELELLRQYRESISPTRQRQRTAWAALAPLVKAGTLTTGTLVMISLAAITVIGGGAAAWRAAHPSQLEAPKKLAQGEALTEPKPRAPGLRRPVPAPQSPMPAPMEAKSGISPQKPPRRPAKGEQAQAVPAGLDAEVRSLETIRETFASGRRGRVLALIDEHRTAFAKPVLVEEIDAIEVLALCEGDESSQGRKRLERFGKRFPRSPQLPSLRRACEPVPAPLQRPDGAGLEK